jgi:hypothetical protein
MTGGQVGSKNKPSPAKEPTVISSAGSILANSTMGPFGWTESASLPAEYFGTALEELEAHWPNGQVVAKWSGQATVSPVDVCNVQVPGSY